MASAGPADLEPASDAASAAAASPGRAALFTTWSCDTGRSSDMEPWLTACGFFGVQAKLYKKITPLMTFSESPGGLTIRMWFEGTTMVLLSRGGATSCVVAASEAEAVPAPYEDPIYNACLMAHWWEGDTYVRAASLPRINKRVVDRFEVTPKGELRIDKLMTDETTGATVCRIQRLYVPKPGAVPAPADEPAAALAAAASLRAGAGAAAAAQSGGAKSVAEWLGFRKPRAAKKDAAEGAAGEGASSGSEGDEGAGGAGGAAAPPHPPSEEEGLEHEGPVMSAAVPLDSEALAQVLGALGLSKESPRASESAAASGADALGTDGAAHLSEAAAADGAASSEADEAPGPLPPRGMSPSQRQPSLLSSQGSMEVKTDYAMGA